jgi:hypothetical protein
MYQLMGKGYKGYKGQVKGKGKGPKGGCYNCGGAHFQAECTKGKGKGKSKGYGRVIDKGNSMMYRKGGQ